MHQSMLYLFNNFPARLPGSNSPFFSNEFIVSASGDLTECCFHLKTFNSSLFPATPRGNGPACFQCPSKDDPTHLPVFLTVLQLLLGQDGPSGAPRICLAHSRPWAFVHSAFLACGKPPCAQPCPTHVAKVSPRALTSSKLHHLSTN